MAEGTGLENQQVGNTGAWVRIPESPPLMFIRGVNMKIIKSIEAYQLEELKLNRLYVNIYDLSLKYSYELNVQWKEFFFDLLNELAQKDNVTVPKLKNKTLLENLKGDYELIIALHDLKTDIRDYIEITDYISFQKWEAIEGNELVFYDDEILLVHTS